MANAYPELPEFPYERTSVSMADVILHLKAASIPVEVKRSAYIVFRNESANGSSGVNNNYIGMQADGGRWSAGLDRYLVGTTTTPENQTGHVRRFLCFAHWEDCVDCLAVVLTGRGLYVGGMTHRVVHMTIPNAHQLCRAYVKEWVRGDAEAEPSHEVLGGFLSMYSQAVALFRPGPPAGIAA